jgi:hypothetical protein
MQMLLLLLSLACRALAAIAVSNERVGKPDSSCGRRLALQQGQISRQLAVESSEAAHSLMKAAQAAADAAACTA